MDVTIRNRPLLPHESSHISTRVSCTDSTVSVSQLSSNSSDSDSKESQKTFHFNRVFNVDASQEQIFNVSIVDLITKTFYEGYDSTVFTYGQTGAGKSYTLVGDEQDWNSTAVPSHSTLANRDNSNSPTPHETTDFGRRKKKVQSRAFEGYSLRDSDGIIPRVIDWIYMQRLKDKDAEDNYSIHISFLQIYDEKIYDLLNFDSSAHLRLRFAPTKEFYVENLFKAQADTAQEAYCLLYNGLKNREVASHNMNLNSSRSHSIFTIEVHSKKDNFKAKCNLCDLAGSEKLSLLSTNPSAKLMKESITINKSLLALGKVITSLTQPVQSTATNSTTGKKIQQFIPYRDSKLTSLLRSALGGSSYCILIACIAPSDDYVLENINTLYYASRATKIQNKPVKRLNPKDLVVQRLKERIQQLELENTSLRSLVQKLSGSDIIDPESQDQNDSGVAGSTSIHHSKGNVQKGGETENSFHSEDDFDIDPNDVDGLGADGGSTVASSSGIIDTNTEGANISTTSGSDINGGLVREGPKSSIFIHMPTVDHEIPVRFAGPSQEAYKDAQDALKKLKEDNRLIGKKLVDSVKLLKHYIQTNNEMNRTLAESVDENTEYRFENEALNKENIQLREKIDMLQSLIVSQEEPSLPLRRPSTASIYTRPQTASSTKIPHPERVRTRDEEELLQSIRRRKSSVEIGKIDFLEIMSNASQPKLEHSSSSSSVTSSQSSTSRPSTRSSTRSRTPSNSSRSKTPSTSTSSYPNVKRKSVTVANSGLYNKKGYIPFSHKYQQRMYKNSNENDE